METIYQYTQVAEGTFCMKSPVYKLISFNLFIFFVYIYIFARYLTKHWSQYFIGITFCIEYILVEKPGVINKPQHSSFRHSIKSFFSILIYSIIESR